MKPETFSCAWWWRAFMNLFGPLGWAFSLAKNEQMSNKVGERSIRKSHFLRRKIETYTLQPQQNGQFRALFVAGRTKKEGVIGKTTDFHPEWIVLAGEEEVPPIGVVACRTSPRGHLVVACTKEGESGKVPWRESTKAESWKTKWNLGSWKKNRFFGKRDAFFRFHRPFVFAGSSNRLGVVRGNPCESASSGV